MEEDSIRSLALKTGRYSPEAFRFLIEALDLAVEMAGKGQAEGLERHVGGAEVLAGLREHAREMFGPLAGAVWRAWGIEEPIDWGRIVFLMVAEGLFSQRDTDALDDFAETFDFDEVFVKNYVPSLEPGGDSRPT